MRRLSFRPLKNPAGLSTGMDFDLDPSLSVDLPSATGALDPCASAMFGNEIEVNIQVPGSTGTCGPKALDPGLDVGYEKLNQAFGIGSISGGMEWAAEVPRISCTSTFALHAALAFDAETLPDFNEALGMFV